MISELSFRSPRRCEMMRPTARIKFPDEVQSNVLKTYFTSCTFIVHQGFGMSQVTASDIETPPNMKLACRSS